MTRMAYLDKNADNMEDRRDMWLVNLAALKSVMADNFNACRHKELDKNITFDMLDIMRTVFHDLKSTAYNNCWLNFSTTFSAYSRQGNGWLTFACSDTLHSWTSIRYLAISKTDEAKLCNASTTKTEALKGKLKRNVIDCFDTNPSPGIIPGIMPYHHSEEKERMNVVNEAIILRFFKSENEMNRFFNENTFADDDDLDDIGDANIDEGSDSNYTMSSQEIGEEDEDDYVDENDSDDEVPDESSRKRQKRRHQRRKGQRG